MRSKSWENIFQIEKNMGNNAEMVSVLKNSSLLPFRILLINVNQPKEILFLT